MLLAEENRTRGWLRPGSLGDYGISDAVGHLLDAAKISLAFYRTVTSQQLAERRLHLEARGVELDAQIALEQLAILKRQEELAAMQAESSTSAWSDAAPKVAMIAVLGMVAFALISRRG